MTKQQIRDRERFLGVQTRPKGMSWRFRDSVSSDIAPKEFDRQWGTTSKPLPANGRKSSVKDFDNLKFINETQLKDEVLVKFMQKAGEIE